MKILFFIVLIFCLFSGGLSCKRKQVEQITGDEEKIEEKIEKIVEKKPQATRRIKSEDATLKIVEESKNTLGIYLINKVSVGGVQFTLKGVKITELRTTSRTAGFVANYNKETGIIILVSTKGDKIAPGTGLIAEITCDRKGPASLSDIKIGK